MTRRHHEPVSPERDPQNIDEKLRSKEFGHNLAKLLDLLLKYGKTLGLPEESPESIKKVIWMIHDADNHGTAFRYAGQLSDSQDSADFPDLVDMLDKEYRLLSTGIDWLDAMHSAAPDPEGFY